MNKLQLNFKEEDEMDHDDIKKVFIELVNIAQPDHPYLDDPYPLKEKELDYGYKRHSSSYYASCGPRHGTTSKVSFNADKRSFNKYSNERVLAIYVHEMTHITVGSHSKENGGSHPPKFFQELAFNGHMLLDNWEKVTNIFSDISKKGFILEILDSEVNRYNVDRRYLSVDEYRHMVARLFKSYLIC